MDRMEGEEYTLLIPAVLDAHLPLLKYAFSSPKYYPIVLEETEGIVELGLKYVGGEICYPGILMIGQVMKALLSGTYDMVRTAVLELHILEGCLCDAHAPVMRRALDAAGFSDVPVVSFNRRNGGFPITLDIFRRIEAAVYYGDLLMILTNQVEPYEKDAGSTKKCSDYWTQILSEDLRWDKNLEEDGIKRRFREIIRDFRKIEQTDRKTKKIGVVGEFYTKYCSLGNCGLEKYLKKCNCEYYINGITWYALYYIDTYLLMQESAQNYHMLFEHFLGLQREMVRLLKDQGFYCIDAYDHFKEKASKYVNCRCGAGDGWLIGAEFVNHALNGYDRIICGQPLSCLVSPICGRGVYSMIKTKLPDVQYVSVDYDAFGREMLVKNQIQMLLSL